jgi:hypothetical protein
MKKMTDKPGWEIAFQQGLITRRMKEGLNKRLWYFYSRIKGGNIITYANSFLGVGILKRPQDHVRKKINTVWLYEVGFNTKGNRLRELINVEMGLGEAEDFLYCLKRAIVKMKKRNGKGDEEFD